MDELTLFDATARKVGSPQLFQSPAAPNWFVTALNLDGIGTVSGKGPTKEAAYASCFGEATEILSALRRSDDAVFFGTDAETGACVEFDCASVTISTPVGESQVGSEGLGAGKSKNDAETSAFLELIERHHVAEWWMSERPGILLDDAWCCACGLENLIMDARRGAHEPRKTFLMCIGQASSVVTIAAISMQAEGRWPVLGFAAHNDPVLAAKAAVSELFQMELSLTLAQHASLNRADGFDKSTIDRAHLLETSKSALLSAVPGEVPQKTALRFGVVARELGVSIQLVDLARQDIGVPVFRAIAPGLTSARALKFDGVCGPV